MIAIIEEMKHNLEEMEEKIRQQKFCVVDAQQYMERYYNISRSMEDLVTSRDNWKKKYEDLKKESSKI